MTYQIILTALFYLLLAGLLGILVFIWRENIASNKQDHADQQALISSVMRSIAASERSVASAEEKTVAIKEAVVLMQKAVEAMQAIAEKRAHD